ncbi:MAG: serine/threonine-protein kinase [Geitlerinemataceae cyanobacterium]
MELSPPLVPGFMLDDRYEVIRCLGGGGFGRTYLAKDRHRFDEFCVLKEFAPQAQEESALEKATELFQREAGVLYRLKHPQVPEFRAFLTVTVAGKKSLFLVEQYIDGETYSQRLHQGWRLSEAEAIRFLLDLLPTLEYLHDRGVIHRDISPDNLICDRTTGKPIPIDFGSVKQVAQTATQPQGLSSATQIQKPGYTPPEQMQGNAFPSSDLYALAVTVLVLMTGKSPLDFYAKNQQTWQWRQFVRLQTPLEAIFDRLLATRPVDRYATAREVLQALIPLADLATPMPVPLPLTPLPISPIPPSPTTVKTVVVSPATPIAAPTASPVVLPEPPGPQPLAQIAVLPFLRRMGRSFVALVLLPFQLLKHLFNTVIFSFRVANWLTTWTVRLVVMAIVGIIVAAVWKPELLSALKPITIEPTQTTSEDCQTAIDRYAASGFPMESLYSEIDRQLYDRFPELQGRALTSKASDAPFREAWCDIAQQLLDSAESGR